MPKAKPALPVNRAFAVQVHAEADVEHGVFRGRVEHVVSGRTKHFASLKELAAFMAQIITAVSQDSQ